MSEPLVIVCPGQGAQAVGMGRAWAAVSPEARAVFQAADLALGDRLGAALTKLCLDGPAERLNRTDVSQPAIYTASIACWRGLTAAWGLGEGDAVLAATAGLSLGEYSA
ncbi:MAG: ACP S-malonyltransferase, partial [Planctomycetes bacterium]|nr:ACP S-malonyltransferase [Planctomycetota bacterium]